MKNKDKAEHAQQRTSEAIPRPAFLGIPHLQFQNEYVWFVFLAACDIMLTWVILERRGGEEVNPVADMILAAWGIGGAVVFKFCLVLFVVVACEWISRERAVAARRLVWVAIFISALPVVYSLGLLAYHWAFPVMP